VLALRGERRDRVARQLITVPVITPVLYAVSIVAVAMSIALWLSAWDVLVTRGQAVYVLGLIVLLAFAAVEFLFFIGLMSRQGRDR
jgi:sterol desaturase/sphingolipid hydroxylase (fatty acid hydroxylase superfamily)